MNVMENYFCNENRNYKIKIFISLIEKKNSFKDL